MIYNPLNKMVSIFFQMYYYSAAPEAYVRLGVVTQQFGMPLRMPTSNGRLCLGPR